MGSIQKGKVTCTHAQMSRQCVPWTLVMEDQLRLLADLIEISRRMARHLVIYLKP